jgi:predicted transcriptional regulator
MTSLTLRLDADTKRRLEELAQATERSQTYLARQALQEFLATNEWQIRAIKEAVEEADRAGPEDFIEQERVLGWLDSWGTDEEQDPPR